MQFLKRSAFVIANLLACFSVTWAGNGTGHITTIAVAPNGDIIFTLDAQHTTSVCANAMTSTPANTLEWRLSHDNPEKEALYGALLVAALQDASITVYGKGACIQGQEQVINMSIEVNPKNWINTHTGFSQTIAANSLQTKQLNTLLEEVLATFAFQKEKVYSPLLDSQVDCLLQQVEKELKSSIFFKNVVVPTTHTGDVTFSLRGTGKDNNFVVHYAYNAATLDLTITIVQSPNSISDDTIWGMIDDGMKACTALN